MVLSGAGESIFQILGAPQTWQQRIEQLFEVASAHPELLDLAFIRPAYRSPDSWMDVANYQRFDGIKERHVRYKRHLFLGGTPDAHGIQILTDEALSKAHDISGWNIAVLGHGRHLVAANDLAAWYAQPLPDPGTVDRARRDFGDMILTKVCRTQGTIDMSFEFAGLPCDNAGLSSLVISTYRHGHGLVREVVAAPGTGPAGWSAGLALGLSSAPQRRRLACACVRRERAFATASGDWDVLVEVSFDVAIERIAALVANGTVRLDRVDVLVLPGERGRGSVDKLMQAMGTAAAVGVTGDAVSAGAEAGRHRAYSVSYPATRPQQD